MDVPETCERALPEAYGGSHEVLGCDERTHSLILMACICTVYEI